MPRQRGCELGETGERENGLVEELEGQLGEWLLGERLLLGGRMVSSRSSFSGSYGVRVTPLPGEEDTSYC